MNIGDEYLNRSVWRIYGRIQTGAGSAFRNQSAGSGAWIDIVIRSQPEGNLSSLSPCTHARMVEPKLILPHELR